MIAPGSNDDSVHLVLVDIGNTNVSLATWSQGERTDVQCLPTDPIEPVAERLAAQWDALPVSVRRAAVIGSVCPPALAALRSAGQVQNIEPLLVVGDDLPLPIKAELPEPDRVGTDRLCAAAAAYDQFKTACVVADFGTALTVDLVSDNGVFLGGTILPGVALSARALHEHTALLPQVEVGIPTEILGKDTVSAIRNGLFAMMVGVLREITERFATQIGKWPPLVLTGGDARAIAQGCNFVDRVVPDLCLDGLALAYLRQFQEDDDQ